MNDIETQPKTEQVRIYSKGSQLFSQANPANAAVNVAAKLSLKSILLIVSASVVVAGVAATVVGVYATKSSEEEEKTDVVTDIQSIPINYTKEEFYSDRTKSYFDLIDKLEKENAILYHWNLELDENNNAIFKNKYQYLYNYSTDLKPVEEKIGYHLYQPENYRIIDTDLIKYYKAINGKMNDHLIYGPSINGKEYAKSQSLYSDSIKLGKENKNGISISFNIKKGNNHENLNDAKFFGFTTKNSKGLSVGIYYGEIKFKAGDYTQGYDYGDGVKLGYNENDPYTKYLYYRPFYDDRWHHICIVQKILNEDDLKYIKDKKVGDVMGEYFIDGMSRKNFTGGLLNDYGNLTVFEFSKDDTKTSNDDFFIDEMMIFNKRLKQEEIKTLYELIDQDAEKVIPKVSSVICKMPGTVCGPLPTDICPDTQEKLNAEIKVSYFSG